MEAVHYIEKDTNTMEVQMEIIKNQLQDANSDEILSLIEHLESEWGLQRKGDTNLGITIGFEKFCRPDECDEHGVPKIIEIKRISNQYQRQVEFLGQIYHR